MNRLFQNSDKKTFELINRFDIANKIHEKNITAGREKDFFLEILGTLPFP